MAIHNWLIFLKIALNFTVIKRINSRLFSKTSKVKVERGKWNNSWELAQQQGFLVTIRDLFKRFFQHFH